MDRVSVHDLRNHGAEVLDRVGRGEALIVTRDGAEVAELRPRIRQSPSAADLIARRRHLPYGDPATLRADFDAIPFDSQAARAFGRVSAWLRAAAHKPAARAYDALIAAAAIAEGLPLHTCNPGDFAGIDELDVHPIRHPDRPGRT